MKLTPLKKPIPDLIMMFDGSGSLHTSHPYTQALMAAALLELGEVPGVDTGLRIAAYDVLHAQRVVHDAGLTAVPTEWFEAVREVLHAVNAEYPTLKELDADVLLRECDTIESQP